MRRRRKAHGRPQEFAKDPWPALQVVDWDLSKRNSVNFAATVYLKRTFPFHFASLCNKANMSDQVKELLDVPRDFLKEGTQFVNRCTKRSSSALVAAFPKLTSWL